MDRTEREGWNDLGKVNPLLRDHAFAEAPAGTIWAEYRTETQTAEPEKPSARPVKDD